MQSNLSIKTLFGTASKSCYQEASYILLKRVRACVVSLYAGFVKKVLTVQRELHVKYEAKMGISKARLCQQKSLIMMCSLQCFIHCSSKFMMRYLFCYVPLRVYKPVTIKLYMR